MTNYMSHMLLRMSNQTSGVTLLRTFTYIYVLENRHLQVLVHIQQFGQFSTSISMRNRPQLNENGPGTQNYVKVAKCT